MELKQVCRIAAHLQPVLLIVPYGIETAIQRARLNNLTALLIVPYGIETPNILLYCGLLTLLIVPYGIETEVPFTYR